MWSDFEVCVFGSKMSLKLAKLIHFTKRRTVLSHPFSINWLNSAIAELSLDPFQNPILTFAGRETRRLN
jgi:hypothetical protein